MTDAELEKIARELYFTTSERGLFPNQAIALIFATLQKGREAERRERGLKSIDRICDTCGGEKDSEGRCAMCLQSTLAATEQRLRECEADAKRVRETVELLEQWMEGGECFCCSEGVAVRGPCEFCKTRLWLESNAHLASIVNGWPEETL